MKLKNDDMTMMLTCRINSIDDAHYRREKNMYAGVLLYINLSLLVSLHGHSFAIVQ